MATQLPARALRPLNRRCLLNRPPIRTFSSTRPHAKGRVPQDPDALLERNEHIAKAPSTLMHESAAESLPEDIGMINGHFITPAWRNLPSFWSNKGYYLKILFSKPISVFTLWQYVMEKKNRPRPTIGITKQVEFKEEAEKLYEKLYDSFARGDNAELRKICLPPLADQLSERIRARDGLHMEWHLEKFVRTKIMSQRGAVLGMDSHPESAYRQLVLKIVTDQVLRISAPNNIPRTISPTTSRLAWAPDNAPSKAKRRASEKEVKTEAVPHKKRVTEYLVLQKRMVKGEEDKEWKIWGFANETTPQTIKEELALEKSFRDFQTRQFMA